ncbi:HXXEE domain-containing protein [Nocardia sp. NBC_00508]|uniref:HXXEE domain-containing protein n=1 Tax=Nocardia sp. NBC_00508 TaxID=2975992 RepID=UPI002E808958|nr:HXXEE domain-containing protein [Nocardia sp. NBC_00508]WUD66605.1 HXXEE domain-containing protein [Nocardia sp. NBC_00508]
MTDTLATVRPRPGLPLEPAVVRALMLWVPFAVFVVHTLEEMPGFAVWVSTHFAPLTTETFAVSHIPLILLVLWCSRRAARPNAATGWVVMAVAFQWQFAVNAVFHLGTAAWFGDYSPGMVTAATVALPATLMMFLWGRRERLLTGLQLAAALAIGTTVAAAAIGVLFLG